MNEMSVLRTIFYDFRASQGAPTLLKSPQPQEREKKEEFGFKRIFFFTVHPVTCEGRVL